MLFSNKYESDPALYCGRSKSLGSMLDVYIVSIYWEYKFYRILALLNDQCFCSICQNMSADKKDVTKVDATLRSLGVNRHNRYIARYLASMT